MSSRIRTTRLRAGRAMADLLRRARRPALRTPPRARGVVARAEPLAQRRLQRRAWFARRCGMALAATALGLSAAHAGASGSVALTSDYVFRGVSQTNGDPAVQAGIEFAHDSGAYAGAWGSNVSWLSDLGGFGIPVSNSLELDVYAGYRGTLGERVAFDVGVLQYLYPGDYPSGFNRPDTTELYAGVTVTVTDAVTLGAKYAYAVSDLFGYEDSDGSGYLDISANWQFAPGWTFSAHAGRQSVENNAVAEYADWKLGLARAFDNGVSVALAYTDTDADQPFYTNAYGHFTAGDAVVLTVAKSF